MVIGDNANSMVILDFFSDYPLVAAGLILIIVVVTTYLLLRWFLGRKMRVHNGTDFCARFLKQI